MINDHDKNSRNSTPSNVERKLVEFDGSHPLARVIFFAPDINRCRRLMFSNVDVLSGSNADFTFPIDFRRTSLAAAEMKGCAHTRSPSALISSDRELCGTSGSHWFRMFPSAARLGLRYAALQWSYLAPVVRSFEPGGAVAGILLTFQLSMRYKCICAAHGVC